MQAEHAKDIARSYFQKIWNERHIERISEVVAEDFVAHEPRSTRHGLDGVRQVFERLTAAFPDLHWDIRDIVAEGDKVAVWWTLRGTHRGRFMDFEPTGMRVTYSGVQLMRLARGRIAEVWTFHDELGLLLQLANMPYDIHLATLAGRPIHQPVLA